MLRPGVALGAYPQRADVRDTLPDRIVAAMIGYGRQHLTRVRSRRSRFVRQVAKEQSRVAEMSEFELRLHIRNLRRKLYSEGLKESHIVEAFATVREISRRKLGMEHFDVQLIGGRVMLDGRIAEMETGEGKTLTATLPACTAAMAGIPVHIVTVNDFLVERDAEWMRPVYAALGITVGTIVEGMDHAARQQAYACDVVYCTNKQLVFDYLKDQLVTGQNTDRLQLQIEGLFSDRPRSSKLMLRGLCYAIVDEADSVLVDEARTPLIISNRGDTTQEEGTYREAIAVARRLDPNRDFTVKARTRQVELTDFGKSRAARLANGYGGIWRGRKRREELVKQALAALHLYELDKHYLLRNGKVQIIDEFTGRVMEDRSWERGLHQMIETKEGFTITGRHETLARISYQRFFRRYLRLAGMTGTAREVASEMWSVYRLNVVRIPTNRKLRRTHYRDEVYPSADAKWRAILTRIRALHRADRPVLVGTRSVAASEHLSRMLTQNSLRHRVLNARQDEEEAQIVAQAGQRGRITVATNMAGRGTDIRLSSDVEALGGLHVLGTERHESHRIDRQLFGRSGRQGDSGSYQSIVSLEDELITDCFGARLAKLARAVFPQNRRLPWLIGQPIVWLAQRSAERHNSQSRRELLRMDDRLGDLLAFAGRLE
jgi:preprotein translocase subunit SecA